MPSFRHIINDALFQYNIIRRLRGPVSVDPVFIFVFGYTQNRPGVPGAVYRTNARGLLSFSRFRIKLVLAPTVKLQYLSTHYYLYVYCIIIIITIIILVCNAYIYIYTFIV